MTGAHLLHVNEQRLLVVLPLNGQLRGVWKLITGQLHCHLEAVGVKVTEVIHTCGKDIVRFKFSSLLLLQRSWAVLIQN